MKRILLMLLMGLSVVSSAITGGTTASFTTTVSSSGSTFTARTLTISTTPTSALFTVANLAPGGTTSGNLRVENTNPNSVDFRYALAVVATNPDSRNLMGALQVTVTAGTCASPGATLYSGPLYDGSAPFMRVLGDPAAGAQAGDRTLLTGAAEDLCLNISLPSSAGNPLQGSSTQATFTFYAEQV